MAKKNPVGRPTKYKKSIGNDLVKLLENGRNLVEAAVEIGIHSDTLVEWAKDPKKPEFSVSYKKCKDILKGRYLRRLEQATSMPQAVGQMFLLKCNHGMMEEDKRQALELRQKELKAKLDEDKKKPNIVFNIIPDD